MNENDSLNIKPAKIVPAIELQSTYKIFNYTFV